MQPLHLFLLYIAVFTPYTLHMMKHVNRRPVRRYIPFALMAGAFVCIIVGAVRGEAVEIYLKGINLCLACIGIG